MPLDPFLARKAHLMEGFSYYQLDDPEMAARLEEYERDPEPWTLPDGVTVRDLELDGPHGAIPVRVYAPSTAASVALVWAHGGGFVGGDLDMAESHVVSSELAARAGAVVVSVGYRLATDGVRYPVPLDDVHAAWTAVSGLEFWTRTGLFRPLRLFLGGASAGAALALATALRRHDEGAPPPDGLLLAYPFAHFPNPAVDPETAADLAPLPAPLRMPPLTTEWMVQSYVGSLSGVPRYAFPGAGPFDGLPPTRIVQSECDDLRPSAELLQRQLTEAGIPVASFVARGMPHGHLNRTPSLQGVDDSLDYFADALRGAPDSDHLA